MNSDMNSPAGQQSTGTATHPPTAAVTAARAAANEAAGKAGLEAVQTPDPTLSQVNPIPTRKAVPALDQVSGTSESNGGTGMDK